MTTREPNGGTGGDRGPGRPSVVDRRAVSLAALALWDARGFEATAWSDIGAAVGVSARTLMRHFDSKEELAWVTVPEATADLRAALAATPEGTDTVTALRVAVSASSARADRTPGELEHYLNVIAAEPALAATSVAAHRPWIGAITEFVGNRHPSLPPAVLHGLAVAYQVAAFDALLAWSLGGAVGAPSAAVDRALATMPLSLPPD